MPRIAEESIRQVAEANDIVEVVGGYLQLRRAGSSFKALCPFHNEKTPSFHVSPARQAFHCFGCGAGGGVIKFVMDFERISFVDAVRKLAERAGIRIVEEAGGEPGPSKSVRARLLELHREAAAWFHQLLLTDPSAKAAREYLKKRGMGRPVAESWELGFAPPGGGEFVEWATGKGFSKEEVVVSGLAVARERDGRLVDRFRGRVLIPIRNELGEVVGFSGRILDPDASPAKYINSPETPIFTKGRLLFGLHRSKRALLDAGTAIVCEGQFDLITAFENGAQNVIASQGTAFTPAQASLLKRFVNGVVLCFDADSAGQKAVDRSLPCLLAEGLEVRVLPLPQGEDPDSLIRREGGEAFLRRVAEAKDIMDHRIDLASSSGALSNPRGISETARAVAEILRLIPDSVLRDKSLNLAAGRLNIAPQQIASLLRNLPVPRSNSAPEEPAPSPPPATQLSEACKTLCRLALGSSDAKQWLAERAGSFPFDLGAGGEILEEILAGDFDPDSAPSMAGFLATLSTESQAALASIDLRFLPENPAEAAQATWNGLLRQNLESRGKALHARLHETLPAEKIIEIQKELLDLRKQLQEIARPVSSEASDPSFENKD